MVGIRHLSFGFAMLLATGCDQDSGSNLQSFVRLKGQTNITSIHKGNLDGIPGVNKDPPNLTAALAGTDFNFKVNHGGTSESVDVVTKLAAASAVEVGYAGGTYFFYFSGHGSQDGTLNAADRGFYFKEVADAIKAARKDPATGKTRAISRGIVFADACFSGNLVDGQGKVETSLRGYDDGYSLAPGAGGIANLPDMKVDDDKVSKIQEALELVAQAIVESKEGTFDELIVISASTKLETSGDAPNGGVGTTAFIAALNKAKATPGMTIGQFLAAVRDGASGQTPVFRTVPETLVNETMFGEDQSGQAGAVAAKPQANAPAATANAPVANAPVANAPVANAPAANAPAANANAPASQSAPAGGGFTDLIMGFLNSGG